MKVLEALKTGAAELNRLHSQMPLGQIEELLQDVNEGIEYEREINRTLVHFLLSLTTSQPPNHVYLQGSQFASEISDGELEAELEKLLAAEDSTGSIVMDLPTAPISLPTVPTHNVNTVSTVTEEVSEEEEETTPARGLVQA